MKQTIVLPCNGGSDGSWIEAMLQKNNKYTNLRGDSEMHDVLIDSMPYNYWRNYIHGLPK